MKILCLDDDDLLRALTVDHLRDLGHEVLEADNGDDAMQWIRRCGNQIDLLVLDIRMPSQPDGREVAHLTRKYHPDMPVIYLTAYTGREVADADRDWFLSKPCSAATLSTAIANIAARSNRPSGMRAVSDRLSGPAHWKQG